MPQIKGLTLTQPWATLVALGAKRIETRSWSTPYRGLLAIHAAKATPLEARRLRHRAPFSTYLTKDVRLESGVVLCVVPLVDVVPTRAIEPDLFGPDERAFGDYTPGRYAWILGDDVTPIEPPVAVKGMLGLWPVEPWLEHQLEMHLAGRDGGIIV